MLYFANPSTPDVRAAMTAGALGCIDTPKQGNKPVPGAVWCADNGCFGKGYPGDDRWFAWLTANADRADTCLFAVAPDVVGDAKATLERSLPWLPKIRALGYPVAFVAQDGIETTPIPWGQFDVLFIGGTTEFKLGPQVRVVAAVAKRYGKKVHMGRVNSHRRLNYAKAIGCDSADGTYISFGPDVNLPKMLGFIRRVLDQPELS